MAFKFSDIKKQQENDGLYFKAVDGDNRVRIVSEPVPVWKAFAADKTCTVFLTEKAADEFNKTADKMHQARQRFSVYLINRLSKTIQIGEFGAQVMSQIGDLQENEEFKFDTIPPYDVTINKKGKGLETEYMVLPARMNTDLTEDEKQKIAALEPLLMVWMKDAVDAEQVSLEAANELVAKSMAASA